MTDWTLIEAAPLPPAGNMSLDLGVLAASIAGDRPEPVVRIYGWDPPALSVGAKVDLPDDVRQRCAEAGVHVVRRATGGGCVLHDRDVTYSVVAAGAGRSVLEAYRWVAGCLMAGLRLPGHRGRRRRASGARPAARLLRRGNGRRPRGGGPENLWQRSGPPPRVVPAARVDPDCGYSVKHCTSPRW